MKSQNLGVKIKICGIKSAQEAREVLACEYNGRKVDFLGVIFAKSVRQISAKKAREIAEITHENNAKIVGVFGEQSDSEIAEICKFCALDAVQIYREFTPEFTSEFRKNGCEIWHVFSVKDKLPQISGNFDLVMFDASGANKGGNGICFDWSLLQGFTREFALAGGLSEQNCEIALNSGAYVLDFNSKIEDKDGMKIPEKINKILKITYEFEKGLQ